MPLLLNVLDRKESCCLFHEKHSLRRIMTPGESVSDIEFTEFAALCQENHTLMCMAAW
jgi:hypothetical protein